VFLFVCTQFFDMNATEIRCLCCRVKPLMFCALHFLWSYPANMLVRMFLFGSYLVQSEEMRMGWGRHLLFYSLQEPL